MLFKLLKYDLRSLMKTFLLIWLAVLLLAFLNHFTLFNDIEFNAPFINLSFINLSKIIPIFLYSAMIIAMSVLTLLFIIQRFYNGLLKDEGYLMFTLPVKPWQLITSKGISSTVILLISGLTGIVSILLLIPWEYTQEIMSGIFQLLNNHLSAAEVVVLMFEALILTVASLMVFIYHIYAAIALGHLFNKHRVGMAFLMYLAINVVFSMIVSGISQLFSRFCPDFLHDIFSWISSVDSAMLFSAVVTLSGLLVSSFR